MGEIITGKPVWWRFMSLNFVGFASLLPRSEQNQATNKEVVVSAVVDLLSRSGLSSICLRVITAE